MSTEPRVREASWEADETVLRALREAVFVREQGVPEALEWDGADPGAAHLLAEVDGRPVGCVRLLPQGRIGRLCVLPPWRRRGIGSALLTAALRLAARRGHGEVFLDAQEQALGFYRRHGFQARGPRFLDAGIPHRRMYRPLTEERTRVSP